MLQLLDLRLKNHIYFKEAYLDLNYHGVTVIKGINMNSNPPSENGAGKSLLVSGIANCVKDSHPIIRDRSSSIKKMLSPLGSKNSLRWTNNDEEYKVIKINKKNKLRYKIFKNGEDLKARTPTIAKDILKNIFPLSEEEFYNQVYLDGRRDSLFRTGSFANRIEFISSIYHVDVFDKMKNEINYKRKEFLTYETKISIKKSDKEELEFLLLTDRKKRVTLVKKLEYKTKKLKHNAVIFQKRLANARFQKLRGVYLEEIKVLSKKLNVKFTEDLLKEDAVKMLRNVMSLKRQYELEKKKQENYQSYLEDHTKYKQEKKNIEKLLIAVDVDEQTSKQRIAKALRKWKTISNKLDSKIESAKKAIKDLHLHPIKKPSKESILQHKKYIEKYGTNLLSRMESEKQTLTASLDVLTESISFLKEHIKEGDAECDYCGSHLTHKGILKTLKTKQSEFVSKEDSIKHIAEIILSETSFQHEKDKYLEYKEVLSQKHHLEKRLCILLVAHKKAASNLERFEKAYNALLKISYLKKPAVVQEVDLKCDFQKKIRLTDNLAAKLNSYIPFASKKVGDVDYEAIKKKYKVVQKKLEEIQNKLPSLQAELINDKNNRKKIAALNLEVERWKEQIRDKDLYDFLYGILPKVKMLTVKDICKEIESDLNNYSNLVFCEQVRFQLNVEKGRFDVIAIRNPGKKEKISDVKALSGAEAKAFNLLVFLSILMKQPDSRRTNLVIFDEFDANMGESNRKLFINSFIPMINTIIPHVIVVTPNHDEYPNARTFLVKKRGDTAKLIAGGR